MVKCKTHDIHHDYELPFQSAKRAGCVCTRPDVRLVCYICPGFCTRVSVTEIRIRVPIFKDFQFNDIKVQALLRNVEHLCLQVRSVNVLLLCLDSALPLGYGPQDLI